MNGIIRYQPNNVDTALQALHSVLEFAPDPALLALRDACERTLVVNMVRTPPWWQADPSRYHEELALARRKLEQVTVRIENDTLLVFEGNVEPTPGHIRTIEVHFPMGFPQAPPQLWVRGPQAESIVLPLQLDRVWHPNKNSDFAIRAATDFLRGTCA